MNQNVKRPKIVVVGSLNMDLVVSMERMPLKGETVQGTNIHYISGGKGANQAVGCAKLQSDVSMIGAVGDDRLGQQILMQLQEYGVPTDKIAVMKDLPTGTATILHTEEDNCIVIVPGANGTCSPELMNQYEAAIRSADVLIVQLEIPLSAVQQALAVARSFGVCTILSPAPAQQLSDELLKLVEYITPNETEFQQLSGADITTDQALEHEIRLWQQKYGHTVIVTRGEKGSSYLDTLENKLCTIPVSPVKVVDTTGAGDAFNAALSYGISLEWPLAKIVAFAGKYASLLPSPNLVRKKACRLWLKLWL